MLSGRWPRSAALEPREEEEEEEQEEEEGERVEEEGRGGGAVVSIFSNRGKSEGDWTKTEQETGVEGRQ